VGLCFFINAVDGMNVLLMSYLAPSIATDWNLSPTTLGVVFSAGLAGMAIGGLLVAPLGDRFGRRPLILASLLTMSLGMVMSGFAASVNHLLLARLVVGIGIGTVLACMTALVAEFAPPRWRNFAVGLLQGGYPIGATITGFLTAWALVHHTWRFVLLCSGFGSLAFFPVAFLFLPESAHFLQHLQTRRAPEPLHASPGEPSMEIPEPRKSVLSKLLGRHMRRDTLLLWCAIFFGFMVLYSIVSWIPKLAIRAGLDPKDGIYAGAIYNIGAFCGTAILAWLANSAGLKPLIACFLLAAAGLLILFGGVPLSVGALLFTAFLIGVTLQGGFNGIYPLSTCIYPVEVRSSGLGWAMGVGRAGAVIGPMMSGFILSLHAPLILLFVALAIPLLFTSACVIAIRLPAHLSQSTRQES
jgi:benzoate transport